ncbi:MAG: hypothetical protein ACYDC0_13965 [Acidimicrobiales bacterium]
MTIPDLDGLGLEVFDGFCREILSTQGREIVRNADPLEAEMWMSDLLGMFAKLPLKGEADSADAIGGRFVEVAGRQGSLQSLACLKALAAVGSRRLAGKASRVLATRKTPGSVPDWISQIGAAKATSAWRASDHYGDQDSVMVSFTYPNGDEHCLAVLVDHVFGGIAKDASVLTSPMSEVLALWRRDLDIALCEEPVGVAAGRILEGLETTEMATGAPVSADLTSATALLHGRFGPIAKPLPSQEPMSCAEMEDVVRAFLATRPVRHSPMTRPLGSFSMSWSTTAASMGSTR